MQFKFCVSNSYDNKDVIKTNQNTTPLVSKQVYTFQQELFHTNYFWTAKISWKFKISFVCSVQWGPWLSWARPFFKPGIPVNTCNHLSKYYLRTQLTIRHNKAWCMSVCLHLTFNTSMSIISHTGLMNFFFFISRANGAWHIVRSPDQPASCPVCPTNLP